MTMPKSKSNKTLDSLKKPEALVQKSTSATRGDACERDGAQEPLTLDHWIFKLFQSPRTIAQD